MYNIPNTEEHPQQKALGNHHTLILFLLALGSISNYSKPSESKTFEVVLISLAYIVEAAILVSEGWDMQNYGLMK